MFVTPLSAEAFGPDPSCVVTQATRLAAAVSTNAVGPQI
jgi:hypothetical protein